MDAETLVRKLVEWLDDGPETVYVNEVLDKIESLANSQ